MVGNLVVISSLFLRVKPVCELFCQYTSTTLLFITCHLLIGQFPHTCSFSLMELKAAIKHLTSLHLQS